jgi:hypothetical protein
MPTLESLHDLPYYTVQKLQRWNDRLNFPPTKILERYLRNYLEIVVKIIFNFGGKSTAVIIGIRPEACGNLDSHRTGTQDELSVLIDNVHIVNDPDRCIGSIRSVVWLKVVNESKNVGIRNPLYFSFVSGKCIFLDRLITENRKLDLPKAVAPVLIARKLPDDMVETGTQVVDNFTDEDAESRRYGEILMVLNSLKESLIIVLGESWVSARLKKGIDFGIKIDDILIGPI